MMTGHKASWMKHVGYSCRWPLSIGLLWASEDSSVPANYSISKTRLGKLGKHLNENADVWRKYKEKFQDMIDKGHVVEIPDGSLSSAKLGE